MSDPIYDRVRRHHPGKLFSVPGKWRDNYHTNLSLGHFSRKASYSLGDLKGSAQSKPAVLCAASPHLDDNVAILRDPGHAVVICCDVAIHALVDNGVVPDYVVALDYSPILALHFRDIDTSHIGLIVPTTIHTDVINAWKGPVYWFNQTDNVPHQRRFLAQLTRQSAYPAIINRGFVGAAAYLIARYMGASPVILAGYGFAFLPGRRYCQGVYEVRGYSPPPPTADTSRQLAYYCRGFGYLTRDHDDVINATEGGIFSKNNTSLTDAVNLYCR